MSFGKEISFDPRVAAIDVGAEYPESAAASEQTTEALNKAGRMLGWADVEHGPFGQVIPAGSKVLLKPNFVMHENQGTWGMSPLVTHQSVVQAVSEAVLRTEAAEVVVGDAPLQGCDFEKLLEKTGLDDWSQALEKKDPRFRGILDFRRTVAMFVDGVRIAEENVQPLENFVLFDLGGESLLEPITADVDSFRVTCYDPRLMAKTHAPGCHKYLVARKIMEADVIINLPKLKTHQKAGITCALKNLIGINGNKEYLPHHRIGGVELGGDCYPGGSEIKRALEFVTDRQNMSQSFLVSRFWRTAANQLYRLLHLKGDKLGIEGSWSGNDTVWRTGLDLNRILIYGRSDGTMSDDVQRRVIHIADAVVAGQGNGPLSPEPLPMGLLLAGENAAAIDWVGAYLLGYSPDNLPIVREALGTFRWPLTSFTRQEIRLLGDLGEGIADEVFYRRTYPFPVNHPLGWRAAARASDNRAILT